MKKLILFMLVSFSCFAAEPKFHFRDCVKITRGFYKGCVGRVREFENGYYDVSSDDCNGAVIYTTLEEKDLENAKGCQ